MRNRALLIELLDEVYRGPAWHGPSVREALRGVTAAQAAAPLEGRNDQLAEIRRLLPGMGEPTPVEVPAGSPLAGKTLAQANLRGATGATVLAILREGRGITFPAATEVLKPGDVLALAGTHEAVEAARALLTPKPTTTVSPSVTPQPQES